MPATNSSGGLKSMLISALRRIGTITLTLIVVGGAVGAILLGRTVIADRAAAEANQERPPSPPMTVAVSRLTYTDGFDVTRRFTGQIEPAQTTALGFELAGTVDALVVDEGDVVEAGQPIATLDTRLLEAERKRLIASREALEAQAELARRTTERQTALQAKGFASSQALDNASLGLIEIEARMAEIDAALFSVDVRVDKSALTAPFSGAITLRHVDAGASIAAGSPIVTIVETATPQFRVGLPPDFARNLRQGETAVVAFGKDRFGVSFDTIIAQLDPTTRTSTVLFNVEAGTMPPFGETGSITMVERVTARGAEVPVAALRDGPRGLWEIVTVSDGPDGHVVGTEAVEVLYSNGETAFVRGTFEDGARYVTDGPHRVVNGQRVTIAGGTS